MQRSALFCFLLALTIAVLMLGCGAAQDVQEPIEDTPVVEDVVEDIQEDPVIEETPEPEPESELSPLTEYDLLPFMDMNNIIVLQRQDEEELLDGWTKAEENTNPEYEL